MSDSELNVANLFNVKGWITVVTGGGTGVGRMLAQTLATNGAKVYITGRRLEKLQETSSTFPDLIFPVVSDCTKKEDIQDLVKQISSEEDHVDLLVNNSGVNVDRAQIDGEDNTPEAISKRMFDQSFENWSEPYNVNVAAVYFTSVAFIPLLIAAQKHRGVSGNIINIASVSGITCSSQYGQFSYNANKAATRSLTSQLAYEFRRAHIAIRVNGISPGYFPSQMSPVETAGEKDFFRKKWGIAFGRAGTAVDIGQALLGLAVNEYMTNAETVIEGGYLFNINSMS
ncbi:NAD(P)-binding protein [Wallemia mellicola]|uniref:NAD(P)-binding protein n=1 Tax=Wallemia mellicola TaxID=1708541 RepID=A0AB38MP08_9BASI|nr:NAD(P)-binding protein [Wallemia mellicola]